MLQEDWVRSNYILTSNWSRKLYEGSVCQFFFAIQKIWISHSNINLKLKPIINYWNSSIYVLFGTIICYWKFLVCLFIFFYVYTIQPAVCLLTLFGTGGDTFIPLSFLDQILSADFFFKNFQTFFELKFDINRVILTPCPGHWVL